jgi:hypothetical protein
MDRLRSKRRRIQRRIQQGTGEVMVDAALLQQADRALQRCEIIQAVIILTKYFTARVASSSALAESTFPLLSQGMFGSALLAPKDSRFRAFAVCLFRPNRFLLRRTLASTGGSGRSGDLSQANEAMVGARAEKMRMWNAAGAMMEKRRSKAYSIRIMLSTFLIQHSRNRQE